MGTTSLVNRFRQESLDVSVSAAGAVRREMGKIDDLWGEITGLNKGHRYILGEPFPA
jgi:hypothetical protein